MIKLTGSLPKLGKSCHNPTTMVLSGDGAKASDATGTVYGAVSALFDSFVG